MNDKICLPEPGKGSSTTPENLTDPPRELTFGGIPTFFSEMLLKVSAHIVGHRQYTSTAESIAIIWGVLEVQT